MTWGKKLSLSIGVGPLLVAVGVLALLMGSMLVAGVLMLAAAMTWDDDLGADFSIESGQGDADDDGGEEEDDEDDGGGGHTKPPPQSRVTPPSAAVHGPISATVH